MRHPRRGNGSALPTNNGDDRRDMVGHGDCGKHGIYGDLRGQGRAIAPTGRK